MKRISALLLVAAGMALLALGAADKKPNHNSPAVREFMRQKLVHSQSVLEGIAMEDYDLILVNARKLSAMSQEGAWNVFDGSEYAEQSQIFRRNVEALIKSARLASLDGATLAYVKMTMSCVECHKYVRGKNTAMGGPGDFGKGLAAFDATLLGKRL